MIAKQHQMQYSPRVQLSASLQETWYTMWQVLHTVRWKNDADLAPEFLYEKMVQQRDGPERRSRSSMMRG